MRAIRTAIGLARAARAGTEATDLAADSAAARGPGVNPDDVAAMTAGGVKFSTGDLVATGRTSGGSVVFLETGNSNAGLTHIIERHGAEFEQRGIGSADVPGFIMDAVTQGKVVGYQGRGTGRPIYELDYNGSKQRGAVTVGSNGLIVGANPVG